jgi:hypothetical protein
MSESEPLRALEFYCGIGSWQLSRFSYCQHMKQVGCTALSQGAALETRPWFAHLTGTNLLVLFTQQTMVLASHTGYVLGRIAALDLHLSTACILRSTLARWTQTRSNRSTRTSGSYHRRANRIRCSTQRRRGPRIPAPSLSCT